MKRLFTPEEAGTYLGYSVHSLQRWRCIGGGPCFRKINGRSIRYEKDALDEWLVGYRTYRHTSEIAAEPRKRIERIQIDDDIDDDINDAA